MTRWRDHLQEDHPEPSELLDEPKGCSLCGKVFKHHLTFNGHMGTSHGLRGDHYIAMKIIGQHGRTASEQKDWEKARGIDSSAPKRRSRAKKDETKNASRQSSNSTEQIHNF